MNNNNRDDVQSVGESGDNSPASLAPLYALGALNSEDTAAYEKYRDSSADAQDDAAAFAATADLLGAGVTPPASLKASIMAGIASLPQLPAESDDSPAATSAPINATTDAGAPVPTSDAIADEPVAPATPARTTPAPRSGHPSKAEQKARRRWLSGPASMLAAAVALVAVLLGANAITSALNNGNGLQEAVRLAHIEAQADAARETIRLTNITDEQQLTATLVWSGTLGQSVFIVDGLASLPEDKTYELWYIGEDGPVSAGVFNTAGAGDTWRVLDGTMGAGDAVGVTVEPAGGSEQPTTDPLIVIRTT